MGSQLRRQPSVADDRAHLFAQVEYVRAMLLAMRSEKLRALELKEEVLEGYLQEVYERMGSKVCRASLVVRWRDCAGSICIAMSWLLLCMHARVWHVGSMSEITAVVLRRSSAAVVSRGTRQRRARW